MTFDTFQSAFQPPAKVGAKGGAKPPSNPLWEYIPIPLWVWNPR